MCGLGEGIRVLLIEDNAFDQAFVAEALDGFDDIEVELTTVRRLDAALAQLQREPVDAVLLDLNLPDSRGILTCSRITTATDAPVIALTGGPSDRAGVEAIEAGAQEFIPKDDWSRGQIRRAVLHSIERRRALQETEGAGAGGGLANIEALKTEFINTAAHELHTPMTPLTVHLNLLMTSDLDRLTEDQRRALTGVDRAVRRLGRLTRNLIEATRVHAGRVSVRSEPFDLAAVVASTVTRVAPAAERSNIVLNQHVPGPLMVVGDEGRIGWVLTALLSNAVRYSPDGGDVHVQVTVGASEVQVDVRDEGIGMAPEHIADLFHPFMSFHEDKDTDKAGPGLELFLSKGIVEACGGRIWAQSDGPGKGSVFSFTLPVEGQVPPG